MPVAVLTSSEVQCILLKVAAIDGFEKAGLWITYVTNFVSVKGEGFTFYVRH